MQYIFKSGKYPSCTHGSVPPDDVPTAPFSSPAKRILLRHKETDNFSDKYIKKTRAKITRHRRFFMNLSYFCSMSKIYIR